MSLAAALLSALAVAGDPCLVADEAGRPVVACFDPGNRLELAAGARTADQGPGEGGALELSAAWRWRGDTRDQSGAVSWRRDQLVLDAAAALRGGRVTGARALAWRGAFVRRLAEPFILLPGPRPVRLPFPFDVGMLVEAGGVRWERARERERGEQRGERRGHGASWREVRHAAAEAPHRRAAWRSPCDRGRRRSSSSRVLRPAAHP